MTTLENAVKAGIRIIERQVEKKAKEKNHPISVWRGRKIVPLKKWYRLQKYPDYGAGLKYLPDTYYDGIFFLSAPRDVNQLKERQEWNKDYYDFLEFSKNPAYGNSRCKNCPFEKLKTTFGIEKIILRYIETNIPNYTPSCNVVDIFQCPYGYEDDAKIVVVYGWYSVTVDQALRYCWDLTQEYERAHYVDFLDGHVGSTREYVYDSISSELVGLKVPKIFLYDLKDVYNVLTSQKMMKLLLEQCIEAINSYDRKKHGISYPSVPVDAVDSSQKSILEIFGKNKNLIKLQDLRDPNGHTLEEEMAYQKQKLQDEERYKTADPEKFQRIMDEKNSGICVVCDRYAKICCVNCDAWICPDHWQQHGLEAHNYTLKYS